MTSRILNLKTKHLLIFTNVTTTISRKFMKNLIKACSAVLLATTILSTPVMAQVNDFEGYVNEGNTINMGGYIVHNMSYEDVSPYWTTVDISSGTLRGIWRHRVTINTTESEVSGINAQGRGIAQNGNGVRVQADWANPGTWSRAVVPRTTSGNTTGWDLR
jgi:hypothetical protein